MGVRGDYIHDEEQDRRQLMERTLSYRTVDNDRLILEIPTEAFRVSPRCERRPAELGIPGGKQVRVELRDGGGHLLDLHTYVATLD